MGRGARTCGVPNGEAPLEECWTDSIFKKWISVGLVLDVGAVPGMRQQPCLPVHVKALEANPLGAKSG